jgi:hypothetical protein
MDAVFINRIWGKCFLAFGVTFAEFIDLACSVEDFLLARKERMTL